MRSARTSMRPVLLTLLCALPFAACGPAETGGEGGATTTSGPEGTAAVFDLGADLAADFYAMPMPSDLRLTAAGGPDYTGFPNPNDLSLIEGVRKVAMDRKGFPVIPVAYFRFTAPVPAQDAETVVAAD